MSLTEFTETLNKWGRQRIPFLFVVDFEMKKPLAFRLDEIDSDQLLFDFNGITNAASPAVNCETARFSKHPIAFEEYKKKFDTVFRFLMYGDTYLANLTVKTPLEDDLDLRSLYFSSRARYKLWYRDEFLVFSPEIFVRLNGSRIFSFPMKGTIDASVPRAAEKILDDNKELAEHVTIVDLIRNDLSLVANHVQVTRFRYIDELKTNNKTLLQVSSEINGVLKPDFTKSPGDLLMQLLPAGSVSGAPKRRTIEIIRQAEGEERGYYTGVMGVFDGRNFDSGVMIRFIEQKEGRFYYRSGGGITTQSIAEDEYHEIIDKVYVPVD